MSGRKNIQAGDSGSNQFFSDLKPVCEPAAFRNDIFSLLKFSPAFTFPALEKSQKKSALSIRGCFKGMDKRQGHFAFAEIIADCFSCFYRVAQIIEEVVLYLEGLAKVDSAVLPLITAK
jgi:hypothetical protein